MSYINNYINKLYESGNAYKDVNGNVWFDVLKNKDSYGAVSNQNLDNMVFEENSLHKKFKAWFCSLKINNCWYKILF